MLDAEPGPSLRGFLLLITYPAGDIFRHRQFNVGIGAPSIGRIQANPAGLIARDFGRGEDAGGAAQSDRIVIRDEPQVGSATAEHPDADIIRVYLETGRGEHRTVLVRQEIAVRTGRKQVAHRLGAFGFHDEIARLIGAEAVALAEPRGGVFARQVPGITGGGEGWLGLRELRPDARDFPFRSFP